MHSSNVTVYEMWPFHSMLSSKIISSFTDLQILFGSELEILRELKHRFDELPVHSSVYYQSYEQGVIQRLITPGNELDPTGYQQDCLGMTPLHILTCLSVHYLEVYRLIIDNYPTNLITEDWWEGNTTALCRMGGCTN
jgi:hypothetical protein